MSTASGHTTAIRASRVLGTDVKDSAGKVIGKIEDIVLDKMNNSIMFAVVGFGGVLGIGEKFHPLPWSALDYEPQKNAYVVARSDQRCTPTTNLNTPSGYLPEISTMMPAYTIANAATNPRTATMRKCGIARIHL